MTPGMVLHEGSTIINYRQKLTLLEVGSIVQMSKKAMPKWSIHRWEDHNLIQGL
jgi:hypothetical protein